MLARWYESKNWGDALNPVLIEKISGIKPQNVKFSKRKPLNWLYKKSSFLKTGERKIYLVIGSIMHLADKDCVVWGSGMLNKKFIFEEEPKEILAVRGPLTRKVLIKKNIKCPEVFGDPALLYPKYYNPKINQVFELGIVPHYKDINSQYIQKFRNLQNVKIINVLSGINEFVDEIKSCKMIVSSSLHGLIAADSYNIPSIWIEMSKNVIGDGFKFKDYFLSVGRDISSPLIINNNTSLKDLLAIRKDYRINIDLERLYDSCPFKK